MNFNITERTQELYEEVANDVFSLQQDLNNKNEVSKDRFNLIRTEILNIKNQINTWIQKENLSSIDRKKIKNINKSLNHLDVIVHKNLEKISFLGKKTLIEEDDFNLETENSLSKDGFDTESWTDLHWASADNHLEEIKTIIEKFSEMISCKDKNGRTALHLAAFFGNLKVVELLISAGAAINSTDENGSNSLHFAAENGHFEMIKYLFSKGADLNARNREGSNPLHYAVSNKNMEMIEWLIDKGINSNDSDDLGFTPLHLTIHEENLAACKLLLNKGSKVDCQDSDGWTPFQWAVAQGNLIACKLLLQNGANIESSAKQGDKPLDIAVLNRQFTIADWLINNGANVYSQHSGDLKFLRTIMAMQEKKAKKFFSEIGKTNIVLYNFGKEYLQRMFLANVSEIAKKTDFYFKENLQPIKDIELDGWDSDTSYLCKKIVNGLSAFVKEFPDLIGKENGDALLDMFRAAVKLKKKGPSSQFKRWKKGLPTFVRASCQGHHTGILFWDKQYLFIDLGGTRTEEQISKFGKLQAFKFDKSLCDENIFKEISDLYSQSSIEFYDYIYETLPKRLNFSKTTQDLEIEKLPLPWQKAGNCGWANTVTIALPFTLVYALRKNKKMSSEEIQKLSDELMKTYDILNSFLLIEALNHYMDKIPKRSEHIVPNYNMIATIFSEKFPGSNIDPRIIEKWTVGKERFLETTPNLSKIDDSSKSIIKCLQL